MKAEIDEEQLKGWLCEMLGCGEKAEKKEIKKCKEQKKELEKEKKKLEGKLEECRGSKKKLHKKLEEKQNKINKLKNKIDKLNRKLDRWVRGSLDIDIKNKKRNWVKKQIEDKYPKTKFLSYDVNYQLVDKKDAKKIVREDLTDTLAYVRKQDDFVCNHFSHVFASLVKLKYYLDVIVVIDWDARHSYNIFLYPNGETQTYEPQNDTFSPEGTHYSPGSKSIMYFP